MRAAVYVRISSDPQGLRAGVQRQMEDCQKEAAKRGWEVVSVHADNDTSAYSGKPRPQFEAMCAGLEDGKYDAVLAWAWDRLFRRPVELESFVDLVNRTGVQVALCVSGEVDLSSADGRFHARMLGTVARHESEKKSERVRRAKLQAAEGGKWAGGGKRPFGFESDGVTVRPEEAEVVREVLRRFLDGEALGAIARDLTGRGVVTSFGGRWNKTTLRQILQSERLIGRRVHRGVSYEAQWPALVSVADWELAQALLASRGPTRVAGRTYLLTGHLICGKCGKALTSRATAGVRRYVCDVPARGGCGGISIVAEPLENYVRDKVREKGHGRKAPAAQLAKLNARIRDLEGRLDALDEAHWVEGRFSDGKYQALRASLEKRIEESRDALELPPPPAPTAEGEGLEAKRVRIQAACRKITILPATRKGGAGFDKGRVDFDWR